MLLPIPPAQLKKKLVDDGLIASERFDAISAEAQRKGQNVADILISTGIVTEDFLSETLANALGVERARLGERTIDKEIVKLIPEDVARQRRLIIFGREENGVYNVAMADPSDLEAIAYLEQSLHGKLRPFLATQEDLKRGFSVYGYEQGKDFEKLILENVQQSVRHPETSAAEAASDLPIIAIVDNLVSYAASLRASDIHIEALEDATLIRYRIDGILREVMSLPKTIHPALVARVKFLAGLKIDEHREPQDGRFREQIVNDVLDLRVSIISTYYGEKVEMRLLEATKKPLSLEDVGMLPDTVKLFRGGLEESYGMVLVSGPTGSGKTTTLYAALSILNRPEVNIVSVEDPIEYNIKYVNQIQINPQAGVTFANGLRAILRQDPNVILVGEIRDSETANIAVQAALTGHLLLSSVHTNDAPTAVPRFFDFGIEPFLVASVLKVSMAQRLVRKICTSCIVSYQADDNVVRAMEDELTKIGKRGEGVRVPKVIYHGVGCPVCGGTGYRGRAGIFEVLSVTDAIKQLIADSSFSLSALRDLARKEGMRTMFEDGLLKVELGLTTVEELLRVVRE